MSLSLDDSGTSRHSTSSSNNKSYPMQDLERPLISSLKKPDFNNSTSRVTAQAAFNVVSEPSPAKQLVALSIKNIRIRSRDFAQTVGAIFEPCWMMLILVFLHLSAKKSSDHMSVNQFPFLTVNTCASATNCVHFGYTGIQSSDPLITELTSFFSASEPNPVISKFYTNEDEMRAAYDASPVNFVIGAVFLPSTNLTVPTTPGKSELYQYTILANHTAYAFESYIDSRYSTAQAYIERAAINVRRKANNMLPLSSPLPLKKDAGTDSTGAGRTFLSYANFVGLSQSINQSLNAYYVIFCFQAVWVGIMSILVVEKKKGIRATMSMMGMSRNSYLVSLWIMQNLQNLIMCALMVFILFVGRIFVNSNAFIVWLLLSLFSFNATAFGTIASGMISDPKQSNTFSFLLLIINVGGYGICSAFVFGGPHGYSSTTETLVFLIPSVALGRAINYITGVEAALGGVTFENLSSGSCAKALWMLAIDCVIFYFLAWYFDAVIPTKTSSGLPLDFFLRKSYWSIGSRKNRSNEDALRGTAKPLDFSHPNGHTKQHADMFEQFDVSHIPVEDRGIIQVQNLRKAYSTGPGWGYHLPFFGIFFRLFYPPDSERKSGPFSGVQKNEVVAGLDLEVHRNEIMGFLGHNGAGKTTSLSMIIGMINPTSGSIVVNGHLLPGSSGVKRKDMDMRTLEIVQEQMGVCPQHDVLFDTLTVYETVELYASIKGVVVVGAKSSYQSSSTTQKDLLREYLEHLLDDVYLKEKKNERVSTLSGGMKRKLSVALAFMGDPKVVLLDEPTTGMDIFSKKQIWQLMQDSKAGRAILLTTHSMEEADALSDRIAILSKGELQTLGSSLFLKNRFGVGYRLNLEKRRVMLADQIQKTPRDNNNDSVSNSKGETVLFNEELTTRIVRQYFPDATIDGNTTTDITYVLPTTGTAEERNGKTAQQYIEEKKAALPGLFEHLDREIAANRLGVKTVGLSLTTLEEVFISLQEQEEAERLAQEELGKN
ncbi:hypothetical protein BGZ46_009356 [Entomortierella lignicola]|nr:hypothetical protein BGZ46_009356 [Entomortierella lignicola]